MCSLFIRILSKSFRLCLQQQPPINLSTFHEKHFKESGICKNLVNKKSFNRTKIIHDFVLLRKVGENVIVLFSKWKCSREIY